MAEVSHMHIQQQPNSRTGSPRISGAYGGDRRSLFRLPPKKDNYGGTPVAEQQEPAGAANGTTAEKHTDPAFPTRPRSKSISETGHYVVDVLKVPINVRLVLLCLAWFTSSSFANTTSKTILTSFPYTVTLTMVQFSFSVTLGVFTLYMAQHYPESMKAFPKDTVDGQGIKPPTKRLVMITVPMGLSQFFGHIFTHQATSMIPVSMVHTIKALSPLLTVVAYRTVFKVKYERSTYLSLIPLTLGVVLTCSVELRAHLTGIFFALLSTVIFVSQNMYSKKYLTNGPGGEHVMDKLNMICYCSALALILTFPTWLVRDSPALFKDWINQRGAFFGSAALGTNGGGSSGVFIFCMFILNGLAHFSQNLCAFQVLGLVTPVTYSVASLMKRIWVIGVAYVFFDWKNKGTNVWGVLLTFVGLYCYDRFGGDKKSKYKDLTPPELPK